jgi:hypothetical protein
MTDKEMEKIKQAIIDKAMLDAAMEINEEITEKIESGQLDIEIDKELKAEQTWWERLLDRFFG